MEIWAVSCDSPSAHAAPVPVVDPWSSSSLSVGHRLSHSTAEALHGQPTSAPPSSESLSVGSPAGFVNTSPCTSRSPSLRQYKPRTSPFVDCRGIFGAYPLMKFTLPAGGQVNGYLKLQGGSRSSPMQSAKPIRRTPLTPEENTTEGDVIVLCSRETSSNPAAISTDTGTITNISDPYFSSSETDIHDSSSSLGTTSRSVSPASSSSTNLSSVFHPVLTRWPMGHPQPQLSHFLGSTVSMDDMGMRLWNFYVNNFIPGRTIMVRTNLWRDFAGLCELPSVVSAIRSYMGLYIYDFTQSRSLAVRINREFEASDARLSHLLATTTRSPREDSEVLTLIIILAMQDVVLPERRRKLPHQPRWVHANMLAEEILDTRYPDGLRSWDRGPNEKRQLTRLAIAHTIMVGRALILSQPMTELLEASWEQLEKQQFRFQWLLYGNADEIHGGCGFSPKLMHTISKITWLSACQASIPEGDWAVYAEGMLKYLRHEIRQINSEASSPRTEIGRQPIEDIRLKEEGYLVRSREEMTEVSAEAWRITAIAYMQCRFWRLPRNHSEVVSTINDLAHCVRILPTSGYIFTAQAPLLPVFFLGLLGTTNSHRTICEDWIKAVLQSPIRSSVPPLEKALRHAWQWISDDPLTTPSSPQIVPSSVPERTPWWEHLVRKVQQNEQEILCLT